MTPQERHTPLIRSDLDSKILLNFTPQERLPLLQGHFFIAEVLALLEEGYLDQTGGADLIRGGLPRSNRRC